MQTTYINDIDKDLARQAYNNFSFTPEKRGDAVREAYNDTLQDAREYLQKYKDADPRQVELIEPIFEEIRQKLKDLTLARLHAQSRCASTMITGGAGFNVARNEKRNATERKRAEELYSYMERINKIIDKRMNAVFSTSEKMQSDLDRQKQELASCESSQELMKAINKAIRAGADVAGLMKIEGVTEEIATEALKPDFCGRIGFASYQLSNNLANIKRIKQRIKELESKAEQAQSDEPEKDTIFNGLTIRRNFTEDRLQLLFADMPTLAQKELLKRHGFRWSPRFTAWQRKLTNNAIFAVKHYILPAEPFQQFKKEA